MQADEIVIETATVRCWTAYCPECEEGEIVPFLRARETAAPAVRRLAGGALDDFRAAEAAVQAWRDEHVKQVHGASLAAV